MSFGICYLSIIPCRKEASDASEMVTQLLFGEHYQILEKRDKWTRIRIVHDSYECWIDNKQVTTLSEEALDKLDFTQQYYSSTPSSTLTEAKGSCHYIFAGSTFTKADKDSVTVGDRKYIFDGELSEVSFHKLKSVSKSFLNAPYLWGGRTIAGIDCSGFSQMVYRLCGINILRDASQQAKQGENVSGLEESKEGDLAFFNNQEGRITHVGIILDNEIGDKKLIIHASGKLRIDNLDQRGICHVKTGEYTHEMCLIKRYTNI